MSTDSSSDHHVQHVVQATPQDDTGAPAAVPSVNITPSTPPQDQDAPPLDSSRSSSNATPEEQVQAQEPNINVDPAQSTFVIQVSSPAPRAVEANEAAENPPPVAFSFIPPPPQLHQQPQPQPQPQPHAQVHPHPQPQTLPQAEIAPPVPPKPSPSPIPFASYVPAIYVPSPISTSITSQLTNPAPPHFASPATTAVEARHVLTRSPSPMASNSTSMPGSFPSGSILRDQTLPVHGNPQFQLQQQQQQQQRRLSWDEQQLSSGSSRRASGRMTPPSNVLNVHVPPLTPIGAGPYPPLTTTPSPIDTAQRNGYFTSGNGNGSIQRPQRTHSQQTHSRNSNSNGSNGDRADPQRRVSYPVSLQQQAFGDLEGGNGYPQGLPNTYDPSRRQFSRSASSRRSGVDLSQIPMLEGVMEGAGDDGGGGGGDGSGNGSVGSAKEKKQKSSIVLDDASVMSRERNIAERLKPTLKHAQEELKQARLRARATGWSLNVAIGAQVVLGALTTGVAAATSGKQTSIATSILGGLSTLAASYLAKARGSGEPEASSLRCKDLENFTRELEATVLDRGHLMGHEYDSLVNGFRSRFEEILGNQSGGINMGELLKEKVVHAYQEHRPHIPDSWTNTAKEAEARMQDVFTYGRQLETQVQSARDQIHDIELVQERAGVVPVSVQAPPRTIAPQHGGSPV